MVAVWWLRVDELGTTGNTNRDVGFEERACRLGVHISTPRYVPDAPKVARRTVPLDMAQRIACLERLESEGVKRMGGDHLGIGLGPRSRARVRARVRARARARG